MPRMAPEALESLVRAFYAAFDNRGGRVPTVDSVTSLFADRAIIAMRKGDGFEFATPRQFALPRVELLIGPSLKDFHEWETANETRVDASLAVRTSRYEKRGTMDGQPYAGTGTKSFNFIDVEGRWRILSLAWADDAP